MNSNIYRSTLVSSSSFHSSRIYSSAEVLNENHLFERTLLLKKSYFRVAWQLEIQKGWLQVTIRYHRGAATHAAIAIDCHVPPDHFKNEIEVHEGYVDPAGRKDVFSHAI